MSIGRLVKLIPVTWLFVLPAIVLACTDAPAAAPSTAPNEASAPPSTGSTVSPPAPVQVLPSPPSAIVQPPAESVLSTGQELYVAKGCAACHGQDGEGTDFAPALPGHSLAQVKRQARAPLGLMPIFPPDKISNEELEAIADFIGGLGEGHAHGRAPGSGDEQTLHHWMALFALEAEDDAEAIHHIHHVMELTEGQHLARMQDTVLLIETGEVHEAAHVVETMLAGLEESGVDEATMHLRLGLSSARVDETEIAAHHVEHYLDIATGHEHEMAMEILDLLTAGELLEALHGLELILGGEMIAETDDDHDDTEAPHDDADAHDADAHDDTEAPHDEAEGHDDADAQDADTHDDADAHDADAHDEADAHDAVDAHDADAHDDADAQDADAPDDTEAPHDKAEGHDDADAQDAANDGYGG